MDIKQFYKRALKRHRAMQTMKNTEYFEMQELLKSDLEAILRANVYELTKQQLINVIAMSLTHRPFAPHVILGYLSASAEL